MFILYSAILFFAGALLLGIYLLYRFILLRDMHPEAAMTQGLFAVTALVFFLIYALST